MALHFITGNKGKFEEVQQYIPDVVQLDIDLPELQELDPHIIIRTKLEEASRHHTGDLIVEDTSLVLDCLGGDMPGPLIKWFLKSLGNQGLYDLTRKMGNSKATARTIIGYTHNSEEPHYFTGEIKGTIVKPRGVQGFGWDPIFVPEGHTETFAQMWEKKNLMSMRKLAVMQLTNYLQDHEES